METTVTEAWEGFKEKVLDRTGLTPAQHEVAKLSFYSGMLAMFSLMGTLMRMYPREGPEGPEALRRVRDDLTQFFNEQEEIQNARDHGRPN